MLITSCIFLFLVSTQNALYLFTLSLDAPPHFIVGAPQKFQVHNLQILSSSTKIKDPNLVLLK